MQFPSLFLGKLIPGRPGLARRPGPRGPWRVPCLLFCALAAFSPSGCEFSTGEARSDVEEELRVLVRLGEFVRRDISRKLAVSADLEAVHEADVHPEVAGVVKSVDVEEGHPVRAGDPVIHLVDDDLTLTRQNKQILFEQSKTKHEQAGLAFQEGQSQLDQKKLSITEADVDYKRLQELSRGASGIISAEELEKKRFEIESLVYDRKALEFQVEKYGLATTEQEQNMRLAEVELKSAELNLSRTIMRSPIDGYISHLDLKPGEKVDKTMLGFKVVSLEKLRARLHVPQRELVYLEEKQHVQITCPIYPGESFDGEVTVINPVIDDVSGTVSVIVEVKDHGGRLKPGMFVSGEIILATNRNALMVSKRAVSYEDSQPIVYLVHGDKARRYTLKTGLSDKEYLEVTDLFSSDGKSADPSAGKLVLVGHNNLKEGSQVEVETAGP